MVLAQALALVAGAWLCSMAQEERDDLDRTPTRQHYADGPGLFVGRLMHGDDDEAREPADMAATVTIVARQDLSRLHRPRLYQACGESDFSDAELRFEDGSRAAFDFAGGVPFVPEVVPFVGDGPSYRVDLRGLRELATIPAELTCDGATPERGAEVHVVHVPSGTPLQVLGCGRDGAITLCTDTVNLVTDGDAHADQHETIVFLARIGAALPIASGLFGLLSVWLEPLLRRITRSGPAVAPTRGLVYASLSGLVGMIIVGVWAILLAR